MILVSVIVPVYNVEDYLARCIDSIINQSYRNIEIIVINDGSTDGSLDFLNRYSDSRLKIISKDNGGLSSARNEGLKYATGDYITFVDSDDWINVSMIEIMVAKALERAADIVCVGNIVTDGKTFEDNSEYKELFFCGESCLSQLLSIRIESFTWGKLYRRTIFDDYDCRFPEGYNYEDVATSYKFFSKCERLVVIKKGLYYYYQRHNSIVRTKRLRESLSIVRHLKEMQTYQILNPFWGYYQLKILYGCYVYTLRLPNKEKESEKYDELIESINTLRKKITLDKPLFWYLRQNDFYKVFLVKTNLIRLAFLYL